MEVTVELLEGLATISGVQPIDVAKLVASTFGFYDVDIEPMAPGHYKLSASSPGRTVRFNGTSVDDVSLNMIRSLISEKCRYIK